MSDEVKEGEEQNSMTGGISGGMKGKAECDGENKNYKEAYLRQSCQPVDMKEWGIAIPNLTAYACILFASVPSLTR